MATESRLDRTLSAFREAFRRVATRMAGLTFWQFVLLAFILLVAAGITESFWDKPHKQRIRITQDTATATADKRSAKARAKEPVSAEIRIDEDGLTIRGKAGAEDKTAAAAPPLQPGENPAPAAPSSGADPAAQNKPGSGPGAVQETKEIRIGNDLVVIKKRKPAGAAGDADAAAIDLQLSDEDIEEISRQVSRPHLVPIMFLLILALFVMRMFARGQQRAEKKADAALAVAERETLQRQVLEARLQLLQAQVEPHFLFNSLAAVEHLIETAPARAAKMQRHLIDYLRAAVPRMRQQSSTLGQEVELCVSYLEIMQMRMEERLQFNVTVPTGLASANFPPMMIQSLIENSIRHGLEPKPEGGNIDLKAEVSHGKLCVSVTDTGLGFPANAQAGVGLANIRERLQQLFGAAGTLTIEPNDPCGTRATIALPYAVS